MTTDWGAITRTIVKRLGELDLQVQAAVMGADSDWQPQAQKSALFVIFRGAPMVKVVSRVSSAFAVDFNGRWDIVHAVRSGSAEADSIYEALTLEQRTRAKLLGFYSTAQVNNKGTLFSDGPGEIERANAGTAYIKVVTPYFLRQTIQAEGVNP